MRPDSHARTRSSLHAAGWSDFAIARAERGGVIRRVLPGTYVDQVSLTPLMMLDALRAHFGPEVVAVLGTAAMLHGLPEPWPVDERVHIALPPGREQQQRPGLFVHAWTLPASDVTEVGGFRTTTVRRTLVDLMCTVDRLSAVSALDAALRTAAVDPATVAAMPRLVRRRRGAARSRTWWSLADARSESPLETRIRLRAVDGGHPPDGLQHEVAVDGRRFRADLVWHRPDGRMLLGEADGRTHHDDPVAAAADRRRSNAIVSTGSADIVRFGWADSVSPRTVPDLLTRLLGPPRKR